MTNLANTPKTLGIGNILGSTLPTPMEKPPQPLPNNTTGDVPMMTGVEGGFPDRTNPGSLLVNISGSGHSKTPAKAAQKSRNQQSQADALNYAEVKRIKDRNAAKQATKSTILLGEKFA